MEVRLIDRRVSGGSYVSDRIPARYALPLPQVCVISVEVRVVVDESATGIHRVNHEPAGPGLVQFDDGSGVGREYGRAARRQDIDRMMNPAGAARLAKAVMDGGGVSTGNREEQAFAFELVDNRRGGWPGRPFRRRLRESERGRSQDADQQAVQQLRHDSKIPFRPLSAEGKPLAFTDFAFLAFTPKTMTPRHLRALSALMISIFLAVACDNSEPDVPGSIQVVAGDAQTAAAGTAVPIAPSVKVVSTRGKPLGGIEVSFATTADGVVSPERQRTNAEGVATLSSWTLPKGAGSHQLTATVPGVPALIITATAAAGAPSKIERVSPEQLSATVATDVTPPPAVRVTDLHNNPVPNLAVNFSTTSNGQIRTPNATTDGSGIARSEGWTLGTVAGLQTVQASISMAGLAPVTFTADAIAGQPSRLEVVTQPSTSIAAGFPFKIQPVVDIQDIYGNRVMSAVGAVTASLESGSPLTLSGATTIQVVNGRALFRDLTVNTAGTVRLRFTANGLPEASSASFNVPAVSQCPGAVMSLNYVLGETARFITSATDAPMCFDFAMSINAGQQYLVQVENMSMSGNSDTGVFPGFASLQNGFDITLSTGPGIASNVVNRRSPSVPAGAVHTWDFGAGPIYEIEPAEPASGVRPAVVLRNGRPVDAIAGNAAIAVGDTVVAQLVGIPRLGIPDGAQKAVVRYAGPDLIIAEDVRLTTTLRRQNGATNTPLTVADMQAIAADYAAYAKVQADRFFGGRHNAATEANEGRPIAIHSLMSSDNIWGYTFPNGNYFVWDFWVGTDGSTKGSNQRIERNANNLFMHEIAHMRHAGMNERANRPIRGNRWLVEGFARATERWPIAMRLLGTATPSRTNNLVLPGYPTPGLSTLEDVPAYTQVSVSMYGGYAASSYVFDYFADQVARTTTSDWMTALGEFLVNAGVESDLNAVIERYLPGVDFGTLFTRARLAFYLDDLVPGLPDWTQYHQFQLRASRATQNSFLDPRNLWMKISPGTAINETRSVLPGASFGYVLDGTAATADTRVIVEMPRANYGVVSVTRIK